MSKHTPGPWLVDCGCIYAACQLDENGMTRQSPLAEVTGDQDHEDHYYENCRLIAAAPELLEALKEANAELEYLNDPKGFVSMRQERIMEKARSAIAKAENKHD